MLRERNSQLLPFSGMTKTETVLRMEDGTVLGKR